MKITNLTIFFKKVYDKPWSPYTLIALVIFVIYAPTLFYGIVYFDDNILVKDHYQFNKNISNIPQAFEENLFKNPKHLASFYRPVLRLTFMWDAQFGEKSVLFVSHLTNILLHAISICLLFYFLLKLNIKKETALAFALVLAVHPLVTQTVSWIPGRNDSLLAIFFFATFVSFLNYLEKKKLKHFAWHLFFFALALWTKETALAIPVILGSYLLIFKDFVELKKNYRKYFSLFFWWVLILLVYFISRYGALAVFTGNGDNRIFFQIYQNLPSLIPTIGKIFLPIELSVMPTIQDMPVLYGIIGLCVLSIYSILAKDKNYRMIAFGALWFLVFMILTLTKITYFAPENRIYLPMFGFIFVLLGLGKIEFIDKYLNKRNTIILISILITLLATLTIYRNQDYKDGLSFWKNAVYTFPTSAYNHNRLGAMHYLDQNINEAEKEFSRALSLNPNEELAHNNLGLIKAIQGKYKDAENEYKKEIEINPWYYEVYFNLGLLYYNTGRIDEAEKHFQKAVEINPKLKDSIPLNDFREN